MDRRRWIGMLFGVIGIIAFATAQGGFLGGIERADAREGARTIRVEKGDTVFQIAREHGTNVATLARINQLKDPSLIQVGQELVLPRNQNTRVAKRNSTEGKAAPTMVRGKALGDFTLTAYTAGPESTGKVPQDASYGVTSSGTKVADGITIAVDPNVIPIGSRVYIEGIGYRVAQDTGSAIKNQRIDVFMSDLDKARQFGVKKNIRVELVE